MGNAFPSLLKLSDLHDLAISRDKKSLEALFLNIVARVDQSQESEKAIRANVIGKGLGRKSGRWKFRKPIFEII